MRAIYILLIFIVPFSGICLDLYVPSLPFITDYFHVQPALAQWTLSLFLLGLGSAQYVIGVLSDRIGRRRLLLAGLFASVICAWGAASSASITALLCWRFFQGLAAAAPAALSRAIVADTFSGKQLAYASNGLAMAWGLGVIIAPSLGGYLQHYFSWHASFYVMGGWGLLLFICAARYLPETLVVAPRYRLAGLFSGVGEVLFDCRFLCLVAMLMMGYAYLVFFHVTAPFLVQHRLGYGAVTYGQVAMGLGAAWFLGSLLNLWGLRFYTNRQILPINTVALLGASLLFLGIAFYFPLSLLSLAVPAFFIFVLASHVFTNVYPLVFGLFPQRAGLCSALLGSLMMLSVGLISLLAGLFHLNNQRPIAIVYLVLSLLMVIGFRCVRRRLGAE